MNPKHRRAYIFIAALFLIALLAGQYLLSNKFKASLDDAEMMRIALEENKGRTNARRQLLEKYRTFESTISSQGIARKIFPANPLELFTEIDTSMKKFHVEHTNRSGSSGSTPGSSLQLQISFSGTYYGVMQALAALRESVYIMRVADFQLAAEDRGRVSGAMSIISAIAAQR